MLILLACYGVAAAFAPWLVQRIGRPALFVLALVPGAAFADTLRTTGLAAAGGARVETLPWIPGLDVELAFRMDTLSWALSLLVTGVGALVLVYCARYFRPDDPDLGRFAGVLVAFAGVMYGLVVTDDTIVLYVFWELTTICSYLLIGHLAARASSRMAALQALIVTTAGGLAMLIGLIMLSVAAGTGRISEIVADPPSGPLVTAAVIAVLVGALTKSALVPFHFWLPSAMAAPTPVSAYLHAAAMVKAGVYLIARFAPGFADTPGWVPVLTIAGLATMLVGGWRALRQHDLKLVLAYGTVSQLGFLTVLLGTGTRTAALAGLALLLAHGMFKSTLFLVVGIIDRCAGTRDLRTLSGFGRAHPAVAAIGVLAAASMAGLPPFAGFAAKEAAFTGLHTADGGYAQLALWGTLAGSVLTVAYTARFVWGAFADKRGLPDSPTRRIGPVFAGPAGLLAVSGLVAGLLARPADGLLAPYADLVAAGPAAVGEAIGHTYHLALWHGWVLALGLSAITLAGGLTLFALRRPVETVQQALPVLADADRGYQRLMRGLDVVAARLTVRTQVGSLPVYLAVILSVLVVSIGLVLAHNSTWSAWRWWDEPVQLTLTLVIVLAAVAATRVTRRFAAVVTVGVVGYSVGVVFAVHSAPDLALTQILVETITLVVFILVLRRLPVRIGEQHGSTHRRTRALLAGLVGLAVVGATIAVSGVRTSEPVSALWGGPAYEYGGGRNVVNVALVDIRAWDTFGELSVLVVAATGVASLIFISRRTGALPRFSRGETGHDVEPEAERDAAPTRKSWLLAGRTLSPENRSILLEMVVRLLFHSAIIVSLFLLFSGHNQPGGGFSGGLVAGLALVARYLAGGRYELAEAVPIDAGLVLGLGMLFAAGTGLAGLLLGGEALQSAIVHLQLPVFGDVKLVTSLFFDIGVYLVVVGLMLDVLRSLGAEVDRQGQPTGEEAHR